MNDENLKEPCDECVDDCCLPCVDYEWIVKKTPLTTDTPDEDVYMALEVAQGLTLTDLLGVECKEEICKQANSEDGLSSDFKKLMPYIANCIYWMTFKYWCLLSGRMEYVSKALVEAQKQKQQAASLDDIKFLANVAQDTYDMHKRFFAQKLSNCKLPCMPIDEEKTCCDDDSIDADLEFGITAISCNSRHPKIEDNNGIYTRYKKR